MRKIWIAFCLIACIYFSVNSSFCANFETIYNGDNIDYNYETNTWLVHIPQTKSTTEEDTEIVEETVEPIITLTKKTSPRGGSYSIIYKDKDIIAPLPSNYEFIVNGRLIGVDNSKLKYYEIYYKNGNLNFKPLSADELGKIFPKTEIVYISDFLSDEYESSKKFFEEKRILLVNDTERSFYKYTYKPPKVQQTEIKGLIKTRRYKQIIFSHYGDKDGALKINIIRG